MLREPLELGDGSEHVQTRTGLAHQNEPRTSLRAEVSEPAVVRPDPSGPRVGRVRIIVTEERGHRLSFSSEHGDFGSDPFPIHFRQSLIDIEVVRLHGIHRHLAPISNNLNVSRILA
jgi:hypothetical protein